MRIFQSASLYHYYGKHVTLDSPSPRCFSSRTPKSKHLSWRVYAINLSENIQVSTHDCLIKAIEKDEKNLDYKFQTRLKKMLAFTRKEAQKRIEDHTSLNLSWSILKVTSGLMDKNIAHNRQELSKNGYKSLSDQLKTTEIFYGNLSFIGEQRAKRHQALLDTLYDEFKSARKINKDYTPQQFLERLYFS